MRRKEFIDTLVKELAARKDADVGVANNSTSSRIARPQREAVKKGARALQIAARDLQDDDEEDSLLEFRYRRTSAAAKK